MYKMFEVIITDKAYTVLTDITGVVRVLKDNDTVALYDAEQDLRETSDNVNFKIDRNDLDSETVFIQFWDCDIAYPVATVTLWKA